MKLTLLQNNWNSLKIMSKHYFALFVVLIVFSSLLKAADYSDATIVSDNEEYDLLIAVPNDFNSSHVYSLVVGLQPCMALPTKSYLEGLSALTDSLHMIVICPDLSKTDNWMTEANFNVILASIDSAMALYAIDPQSVYLTGMSCNGATTLQEGLKKIYPFKGIFPWAPYLSAVDDKIMDLNSDMPITIAVGTSDDYLSATLNMYDSLKTHGSTVNLVLVEGINHTYSFANFGNEMIHAFYYLLDTNSISIEYSENELSDFEIENTDPPMELTFNITNQANKELTITSLSSKPTLIANPEITYTPADGNVILKFASIADKFGSAVIVLEAKEKDGTSYEQITFKVQVNKTVSINSNELKSSFDFYPNPANDKIYLKCEVENLSIQICDINGRIVLKTVINTNSPVDVSMLKKGMYILQSVDKNKFSATKFFVQ